MIFKFFLLIIIINVLMNKNRKYSLIIVCKNFFKKMKLIGVLLVFGDIKNL